MTPSLLSSSNRLSRLVRSQEAGLLLVITLLSLLLIYFGAKNGTHRQPNLFLNFDNLFNGIATDMSIYAIMAVGVAFVIIAGGIDISVGSIFGLSALLTAWALQNFEVDTPAWKVLPIAMGVSLSVGALCGLVNGLLVVGLRLHPFIVTLGTLSIFRGLCNVLPPEPTLPTGGRDLPDAFTLNFMQLEFANSLRLMPMIVMLLCVAFGWIYLRFTVPGRANYAIGGNEEAARFSGLPVSWIKIRVYVLSGLLAGIAGMVSVGRFGTASTSTGETYELFVIASAVVGGVSLNGGRGTALGALFGALIIKLIENGIFILKLNQLYGKIIVGIAIIVAVAIDRFSEYLRNKRARKAQSH